MPNNSYLRSRKRERELVNQYRKQGWIAARSAGSKSAYDVWAFHPGKALINLIQVKTTKGGSRVVIKNHKVYPSVEVVEALLSYETKH